MNSWQHFPVSTSEQVLELLLTPLFCLNSVRNHCFLAIIFPIIVKIVAVEPFSHSIFGDF